MLAKIIQFIIDFKGEIIMILTALYELLARLVPNSGQWSIIKKIIDIINFLFPNRISRKQLEKQANITITGNIPEKIKAELESRGILVKERV